MLVMILIKDLILQTMNSIDHYPEEEIRKWLMKDELGRKVMAKFVGLRPKMYSYIKYNGNDDKSTKEQQSM